MAKKAGTYKKPSGGWTKTKSGKNVRTHTSTGPPPTHQQSVNTAVREIARLLPGYQSIKYVKKHYKHPVAAEARLKVKYAKQLHHQQSHGKAIKAAIRKAIAPPLGTEWVLGMNDKFDTCLATGVANSLLATTGIRVSDQDVLAFDRLLDGVLDIGFALIIAREFGIGGHLLKGWRCVESGLNEQGALLGSKYLGEDHVVVWTEKGLVSWGGYVDEIQLDGETWIPDWGN